MSPNARPFEVKKEKTRNKYYGIPLENVVPIATRDGPVILRIYCALTPQQSGSLKVNFLTTPSSPTMTSERPAQK